MWKMTHHFLQALNSKCDIITMTLTAQTNIKEIPLEDLLAKLENNKEIYEGKLARREPDSS